jgi:hypothetical protein
MVGGSFRVLRLLPPLKTGRHDKAEILLKMALNTKKSNLLYLLKRQNPSKKSDHYVNHFANSLNKEQ